MTDLLIQLGALAQGSGMEEWGNILFIAVMAILWLGGGLIKAAGRKGSQQQRRREGLAQTQRPPGETWQQRLARKAEEIQRAAEAKGRQTAERVRRMEEEVRSRAQSERPRPAQPPSGNVAVRSGPRGESIMVYERPGEQISAEQQEQIARQREAAARRRKAKLAPPVKPGIETGAPRSSAAIKGLAGTLGESLQSLEPAGEKPATGRQSAGFQADEVIDYRDSDALKKAILHHEIFGKPVALRGPSGEASIF